MMAWLSIGNAARAQDDAMVCEGLILPLRKQRNTTRCKVVLSYEIQMFAIRTRYRLFGYCGAEIATQNQICFKIRRGSNKPTYC